MKQILILSLLCLIVIGCSRSVLKGLAPCAGTVTLDGAAIDFAPIDVSGKLEIGRRGGTAISNSAGRFTIKTASDSPGIAPGVYKVRISKMVEEKAVAGKSPIPKSMTGKYAATETSDLTVEIPAGGDKNIKLELKLK
ncbi:MAG: carboxypeptidase-like regulatory domain-containing protein [Planctomycetaceae bacterium]|jgi:type IV secretory pathway TrbL component|nr:carboxypeptidase-like regulatory domain-containing protein [Planctomycetaceae bacterium]